MNRYSDNDELAGLLLWVIKICAIAALVAGGLLLVFVYWAIETVVEAFKHASGHQGLQISFGAFAGSALLGLILTFVNPVFLILALFGLGQLLITCIIVTPDSKTLLQRDEENMVSQILNQSWWDDSP